MTRRASRPSRAPSTSVATGNRIIHISGQTGVDADANLAGTTHLDQSKRALSNLRSGSGRPAHRWPTSPSSTSTSSTTRPTRWTRWSRPREVYGEDFPVTASTLIGVSALFQPGLLIEIDAVVVV